MQQAKSSTSVDDIQLRDEPVSVKNVLRKIPESQSSGRLGAPSGSRRGSPVFCGELCTT